MLKKGSISNSKFLSTLEFGNLALNEYFMLNPFYSISGIELVLDFRGLPLASLMKYFLSVKSAMGDLCKSYPTRVNRIHFIDIDGPAGSVIGMIVRLMTKDGKRKVKIHQSLRSLHKYIPKMMLPEDLGGEMQSIDKIKSKNI